MPIYNDNSCQSLTTCDEWWRKWYLILTIQKYRWEHGYEGKRMQLHRHFWLHDMKGDLILKWRWLFLRLIFHLLRHTILLSYHSLIQNVLFIDLAQEWTVVFSLDFLNMKIDFLHNNIRFIHFLRWWWNIHQSSNEC